MARATHEQRAQAIARVEAGESARSIAGEYEVDARTVARWAAGARCPATSREENDRATAAEIAQQIKDREAAARRALLDRLVAIAPQSEDNVQQLATAYGILTDKANIAAGKPTSIVGRSPDERDREIERLLQEEAAKRGEDVDGRE